jgi:hypothetical protein
MTLDIATGNFGVGTTSPVSKLTVNHTSADAIRLERAGRETWSLGLGSPGIAGGFLLKDETDNATRLFIDEAGSVGIGTVDPTHRLHVQGSVTGHAGTIGNHIALIQNTNTNNADGSGADVLALQTGPAQPTGWNNWVTFFDGNSNCHGEIQGTGAVGVQYKTSTCDDAEYMPKRCPDEHIEQGDVVGILQGRITKQTSGAELVASVSTAPMILGNAPSHHEEHLFEKIAFLGQVPVNVRGAIRAGDYIIPSGENDGVGVAVAPAAITPEQVAQIVGQAWESSDQTGVKKINALVGISPAAKGSARIVELIQRQGERIRQLEDRLTAIEKISGRATAERAGVSFTLPVLVGGIVMLTVLNLRRRRLNITEAN